MIARNAVPIAHVTPRPRIQIGQADARPSSADMGMTGGLQADCETYERLTRAENARIWSLIKGAAEGSNVTSSPVVSDDWSD